MNLQDLLTRVEAATGPDHEIDGDISRALGLTYRDDGVLGIGPGDDWPQAEFTASIDAALELVERLLPGWPREMYQGDRGSVVKLATSGAYSKDHWGASRPTLPLAILAALLRALLAQEAARKETT